MIPVLASLKYGHFAFFSNKMQDITLIKKLATYAKIVNILLVFFHLTKLLGQHYLLGTK